MCMTSAKKTDVHPALSTAQNHNGKLTNRTEKSDLIRNAVHVVIRKSEVELSCYVTGIAAKALICDDSHVSICRG